jgi:hypothetical protein
MVVRVFGSFVYHFLMFLPFKNKININVRCKSTK